MFFNIIAGVIICISLLVLYGAFRMLVRKGWILAWLRGMLGLVLLAVSTMLVLVALDLLSYREMQQDKLVGTISFIKTGEQSYRGNLLLAGATQEQTFQLKGDQWQIDARIIRWDGMFNLLGAKPGYRLDRISGRYYSLADERSAERTVYPLETSDSGLDVWAWAKEYETVPWVDAVYGSATFVPMEDGALFEIMLSNTGLAASPLNDAAQNALKQWQ